MQNKKKKTLSVCKKEYKMLRLSQKLYTYGSRYYLQITKIYKIEHEVESKYYYYYYRHYN